MSTIQAGPEDVTGVPDDTVYECGVCWSVYDPALGDPYAQVKPGTPFNALSVYWHCPNCETPKARFMAVTT